MKRAEKGVYKRKWRNAAGEMVMSDTWTIEWFIGEEKFRLATGLKSKSAATTMRALKIAESVKAATQQKQKLHGEITLNEFVKTVYFCHVFKKKVGLCLEGYKADILAAVKPKATNEEFKEYTDCLTNPASIRELTVLINRHLDVVCSDIADSKAFRLVISSIQNPVERAVLLIMRFKMMEIRARVDVFRLVPSEFGERFLNDIDGDQIQKFRRELTDDALSASTRNKRCGLIKHIFSVAYEFKYVTAEKLVNIRIDKQEAEDNERHVETTPEDRATIVETASKTPYMWELIVFAIYSGLRRNKIFRLKWSDVFLDVDTPYYCIDKDKNNESARTPLSPQAIEVLRCRENAKLESIPWVFYNVSTLNPYDNVDKTFLKIMKVAGRPDILWHDMRHIFCTMVADTPGVQLPDLMAVSGHKDTKMAMRYINRSLANKAKTVAGLK